MIYGVLSSISRDYPPLQGMLSTCYWAVRRVHYDSRLACLNRTPIAVAAGRINRSQINWLFTSYDGWNWNWQFTMFHRCPAKRHTHYDAPSNGTFVASNVRIQENTPWCRRRSWFSIFAVWNACRFQPRISEYIEGVYNGFGPSHPTTLLVCLVSCTAHYPVMRFSTYTYLSWKKIGYCFSYISI